MHLKPKQFLRNLLGLTLVYGLVPSPLSFGQTTQDSEDIEELSPFEVTTEGDIGYLAGNSVSGSRFNSKLSDTPATLTVFTEEFLADLGASGVGDILEYGVNANVDFDQNRPDPTMFFLDGALNNQVRINNRGLIGSTLADFFQTAIPTDSYNTGRFDLASGPNSVLFGVAAASGSLNTTTKQAILDRQRYSGRLQFGSYGEFRAEVDANVNVIQDRVGLRVMGMHSESDGWKNYSDQEADRLTVSGKVKPFKNWGTTLVANYEEGELKKMWFRPFALADNVSFWETLPDSERLIDNRTPVSPVDAAARGTERLFGGQHFFVSNDNRTFSANLSGIPLYTSASFFEGSTNFNGLPGFKDRPFRDTNGNLQTLLPTSEFEAENDRNPFFSDTVSPHEIQIGGPDAKGNTDFDRLFISLQQPLGENFFFDLSYVDEWNEGTQLLFTNSAHLNVDPNLYIPDENGNPISNPRAGQYYVEGRPWRNFQDQTFEALRATLYGDFDFGAFGQHQVLALYEDSEKQFRQAQGNMVMVDSSTGVPITTAGNVRSGNNAITLRTYVTPGQNFADWFPGLIDNSPITIQGRTFDRRFAQAAAFGSFEEFETFVLATQSAFFDDRFILTAGYRWDDYSNRPTLSAPLTANDPEVTSGQQFVGDLAYTGELGQNPSIFSEETYTVGAVFHVSENLSVFANEATNIAPSPTNRFVIGTDFQNGPPISGEGRDFGVILSLLENKIVIRATYFDTEIIGDPTNRAVTVVRNHDAILSAFKSTINPATNQPYLSAAEVDPLMVHRKQGRSFNSGIVDGAHDNESDGVELDIKLNLTQNWTLTAAFSHTNLRRSNIFSEFEDWFASVRPTLEQFGDPAGLQDELGNEVIVSERIEDILLEVDAVRNVGEFGFNNRPNKFNVFSRYGFTDGPLDGFFVGGGARWQSENEVQRLATGVDSNGRLILGPVLRGPDIFELDALIGYGGESDFFGLTDRKASWRVQLNAFNILDDQEVQVLRYSADGERLHRSSVRNPVSLRFTFQINL